MTKVRIVFPLFACFLAAPSCFGVEGAGKPARKMGSPEHFELRAAWFLQRMIKTDLALSGPRAHAVDLVFADYVRRTAEQLPRPVLIAYPLTDGSEGSGSKEGVITAQAGQRIEGKIQRRADGSAVMLVENLLEVLDPKREPLFRKTLLRWAQIKPEPISIPIIEVMRTARDPMLQLSPTQNSQIQSILRAKAGAAMSSPMGRGNTSEVDPLTERIREQIVAILTPAQRRQFETTLVFVEAEVAEWRAMKTGGNYLYAEALALLDAEAKKKDKPSGQ